MRHHVDVLGLLHIVWGVFGILAGVALAILSAATSLSGADGPGPRALVWLFAVAAMVTLAGGAALIVAGRGLRRRATAARALALALSIPDLLLLPFGTALSIYGYWVLLNNESREAFGRPARPGGAA